jgi:hypothetical protein
VRKAAKEADSIVAARPSTPYLWGKKSFVSDRRLWPCSGESL